MRTKIQALLLLLPFVVHIAHAQAPEIGLREDVRVLQWGLPLPLAWSGGLNAAQFSSMDLDNDGTGDLLVYDRTDDTFLPFLHIGNPGEAKFRFAPEYLSVLPVDFEGWALARDYDGDGYMDLFGGTPVLNNVRVYRNVSADHNDSLFFELVKNPIRTWYDSTSLLNMYSSRADIPAIEDIDGDGDLDFLTFDVPGALVEWHKNVSVDSGYGLDSLHFALQSFCFGHFEEDANTCSAVVDEPPCKPGMRMGYDPELEAALRGGVHSGSTMLSLDLNADGLMELVLGDVGCNTLYTLYNNGTSAIAHFDSVQQPWPATDPVDIPIFPAAYYVDVNADGLKDLVSAPNFGTNVEDDRGVWMYQNQGQNDQPDFAFQQTGFFQRDMIDIGTGTAATFFDYDGDGKPDLLAGNQGAYNWWSAKYNAYVRIYRNTGDGDLPEFKYVPDEDLGFLTDTALKDFQNLVPTAGDLDGDGDADILLGEKDGTLLYFENTAGAGQAGAYTFITANYAGIDVGVYSAPFLFDAEGDGDLDLLVGHSAGYIYYYENIGSASNAQFSLVTQEFGNIKISDGSGSPVFPGFAKPCIADYDEDGDMELLCGGVSGKVNIFENYSLNPADTFVYAGDLANHDFGAYSAVTAGVIDSSGHLSYVIGNQRGGFHLAGSEVTGSPPLAMDGMSELPHLKVWPNPADEQVRIEAPEAGTLKIYDLTGRPILDMTLTQGQNEFDVAAWTPGLYLLRFESRKSIAVARLMVR